MQPPIKISMADEVFWADKVAKQVIAREAELKRGTRTFRTEMGVGASGVPHIGSTGDGIRSYVVMLGLKNLGVASELIAFVDDRDGLRKVPLGFPSELENDIGKPVATISDPFGCHKSFALHVSSLLTDAFEKLGVQFKLMRASEEYSKGTFDKEIVDILNNAKAVGQIIKKITGQDKYLEQLPFMPFCEKCGRVNTTVATSFNGSKITYSCTGEFIGKNSKGQPVTIKGCGWSGEAGIHDGKLAWKADFAARWRALRINYEAYGKDITESVKVSDEISRQILKWEPPLHSMYEMFTQRGGKKISKSVGNVFTPQLWLKYASSESLRLLFLKKLGKTRVVDIDAIPAYVEEADQLAKVYFGDVKVENERELSHMRRLYEYINFLRPPSQKPLLIPYSVLLSMLKIVPEVDVVKEMLTRTGHLPSNIQKADEAAITERITRAKAWVTDAGVLTEAEVKLTQTQKLVVSKLIKELKKDWAESDLEKRLYELARESKLQPKEFFQTIYRVLLGSTAGPRLAMLILAIGKENVASRLSAHL